MNYPILHIDETDSTNKWLRTHPSAKEMVVVTDFQTAGRGCGTNKWESERGKNLLFSILLHPKELPANQQFHISMAISLAICEALGQHIGNLSIKWPNDIYWQNGKICGILIENTLRSGMIKDSIVGVGLNINQQTFRSDAPNPVSLWQITEVETDRQKLLNDILDNLNSFLGKDIRQRYLAMLYRRNGFYCYTDSKGAFMAEIVDVEDDGHLLLNDDSGRLRRYAFKEVQFVL